MRERARSKTAGEGATQAPPFPARCGEGLRGYNGADVSEPRQTLQSSPVSAAASPLEAAGVSGAFALMAELTQGLAESLNVDAALDMALERIVEHVDAEAGSLWLADAESRQLECRAQIGPGNLVGLRIPMDKGIIGRSVRENTCQLVADPRSDPGFYAAVDARSSFVTRSLVCAPLGFGETALGAIQLVNKRSADGAFTQEDRYLLRVLASSAGLALANARMASAAVNHESVRRELELASEIQRSLLPALPPAPFPVYGVNVPARTVSGDFFDILELDAARIAFCLGDVSGKGMNAALLATKTASLYRYLTRNLDGPGAVLRTLNDELEQNATRGMFVTMLAGGTAPRSRGGVRRECRSRARPVARVGRRLLVDSRPGAATGRLAGSGLSRE